MGPWLIIPSCLVGDVCEKRSTQRLIIFFFLFLYRGQKNIMIHLCFSKVLLSNPALVRRRSEASPRDFWQSSLLTRTIRSILSQFCSAFFFLFIIPAVFSPVSLLSPLISRQFSLNVRWKKRHSTFFPQLSQRNHFDPLNHFLSREESFPGFFPHSLSQPAFLGHGLSHLSSNLYAHHPAVFNMNALSPEEMERYQELSNKYEPDLPGPLVSHKQPTSAIAIEYANAHPAFATKTSALAVTHPDSRIMKGDGNCGWRAVAFGYFENLFHLRDPLQAHRELVRIKSLNTLLDQVGQQEHLYEIFVDATEEVFGRISGAIESGERDDSFLVELFNDEYNSNAIITHFRLLTSAWMKLNPHRYQAFLSTPLDQYCATRVETVKTEIDEVGLQALVDGVIEGSGLVVEVLYLDRSEGEAVTSHVLTQSGPGLGAIRLLYRPGHYDLLYQAGPTINMQPVVNFQYAMSSDYTPWDNNDLPFDMNSSLMAIPNLMMDTSFAVSSPVPQPPSDPYRVSPPQEAYQPPIHTPPPPTPITSPPPPIRLTGPPPPIMSSLPPRSNDGPQIRLNPLVMKPNLSHSLPVTAPFKNSPYNQAHFQNQDFEPIHWEPHESRK